MFNQTLCFIKRANEILMLNREKAPTKGLWNGVGGKMEKDETPLECVIREVQEETAIELTENQTQFKGIITWEVDQIRFGGLYVFFVDMHSDFTYPTPKKIAEGILDWKEISWLLDKKNFGVGEMLPHYLPEILHHPFALEHQCILENNTIVGYEYKKLESEA